MVQKLFALGWIFGFMCIYLQAFICRHSGTAGMQKTSLEIQGKRKAMSEPRWCVLRHSKSSQDFACMKIEHFFICVFVSRVRNLRQSDFHV